MLKNQVFIKRCAVAAAILTVTLVGAGCGGGGGSDAGPVSGAATGSIASQDRFLATVSSVVVASPDDDESKETDAITVTTPQDGDPAELDS